MAASFLARLAGEAGGVLAEKGQRKEGDGDRSCVGLLLGLCRGLMACSIRPLPSFSMCFWGEEAHRSKVTDVGRGCHATRDSSCTTLGAALSHHNVRLQ